MFSSGVTEIDNLYNNSIFLQFLAYSCRKVSRNDKFAAKSNIFWEFMLDIIEKVLTLQRI